MAYHCKITDVWEKGEEVFYVEITYSSEKFNYGPFQSAVDAGNFATEWYVENYTPKQEAICAEQESS